jgi:hypothetical protein
MLQYIRALDTSVGLGWDLVRWCHALGADEFSWREMGIVGHPDPTIDQANRALASFRIPDQLRPTSVVYSGEADRQTIKLWRLNAASIEVVIGLLPEGIFTAPTYSEEGWIEDLALYRAGELLLGVISHEDEAVLHLENAEAAELVKLGFSLYPSAIYGQVYGQPSNDR